MTLQFRTRTRSIYDYGKDLKTVGTCCFANGTSANYTFVECFQKGGNFFPDENIICPERSERGYCCSCIYTSEFTQNRFVSQLRSSNSPPDDNSIWDTLDGIASNITKCECDRIGGNWSESLPDPAYTICRKNVSINGTSTQVDVRVPSACCHPFYGITFINGITCSNVCNARQCANLVEIEAGSSDIYMDSIFNQYKLCGEKINNSDVPFQCTTNLNLSMMTQGSPVYEDQNFGACFTLDPVSLEYSCRVTPHFDCDGYWVEQTDGSFCNTKLAPKNLTKSFDKLDPVKYTEQEFNSLNLQIGDEFQGGIYIGIFKPKKTNTTSASTVYGSLNFSNPISNTIDVSNESPYTKWAIIVNKNSITTNLFSMDESINPIVNFTSYYDGFMNCYGENLVTPGLMTSTINTIKERNRNGFMDYYIPSIIEMMFFAEQFKNNEILQYTFNFINNYFSTTIFTDKYCTNNFSNKNNFNEKYFLYGLNFGQNTGKTTLTGINTYITMMLFRRIVII